MPNVQVVYDRYHGRGVMVVGEHATGTAIAKVAAYVKSHHLTDSIGMVPAETSGIGKN